MSEQLRGRTIAILAADGVEQVELEEPKAAVDKDVIVDGGLVTSRNPDDLPVFCDTLVRTFAEVR